MIRNLLAIWGLLTLILVLYGAVALSPYYAQFQKLDPQALETYQDLGRKLLETGDSAAATIWRKKVQPGLSAEDVEQTMKFVANEYNISNVGELPLYRDVEAKSGEPYRFAKIYMFCNSLTAAKMMDYSDAFSAYLPCRLSLLEDANGDLWIYTLNMDLMIYGGKPLPDDLKQEALRVKETILAIMNRGAAGEF